MENADPHLESFQAISISIYFSESRRPATKIQYPKRMKRKINQQGKYGPLAEDFKKLIINKTKI